VFVISELGHNIVVTHTELTIAPYWYKGRYPYHGRLGIDCTDCVDANVERGPSVVERDYSPITRDGHYSKKSK
jgi:hypothetical protein